MKKLSFAFDTDATLDGACVTCHLNPAQEVEDIRKPRAHNQGISSAYVQLTCLPAFLREASRISIDTSNEPILEEKGLKLICYCPKKKNNMKIGVLGCGSLGFAVSKLLSTKFPIKVFNRTSSKCAPLAKLSVHICSSVAELVLECDIILCCLKDADVTKKVIYDDVIPKLRPETTVVVLTTMDRGNSLLVRDLVKHCMGYYVEAPVHRRTIDKPVDCTSDLIMLVSTKRRICERIRPVLDAIATDIVWLDSVGGATIANLIIHNFMGSLLVSLSEAVTLGQSLGLLDIISWLDIIAKILSAQGAFPHLFASGGQSMLSTEAPLALTSDNLQRSMMDCIILANESSTPIPIGAAAHQALVGGRCDGLSRKSATAMDYAKLANLPSHRPS